jgi:3-methyl-2-oxobutanoate hydroxymethyltransferase
VLVLHDLLGLTPGRVPKFVKQYANLRAIIDQAVRQFMEDVQSGEFPGPEHSFR